ncbi:MAG TPA: carbohydrate binding domain-containing protein [Tepidiformaceae bacterium]
MYARLVRGPLVLMGLLVACGGIVQAENLLQNPSFEPPEQGGVAQGWRNNVWGDCQTNFSLDEGNPHSGKTSQKIECVRRNGGASQFLQPLKLVQRGVRYRVQLWVRAAGNVPLISAAFRKTPEPYTQYLSGAIEPGLDWQLLEFEGRASGTDDNAGLYVWFEADGAGTVWVDDASVEIVEAAAQGGPAPDGNVIPNGSFEVNPTRTWDNIGVQADWPCPQFAAHGQRSMHFRMPGSIQFGLNTPCIPFSGNGEQFTFALSARATGGPVTIEAQVWSADRVGQDRPLLTLIAKPDGEMRRYATKGVLPQSEVGAYFVMIAGKAPQAAEIWLDAVSLSRKGEAFEAAHPLEAALSTKMLANVFAPEEAKAVRLEVANAGPAFRGSLRLEVRDYREGLVCEVPVAMDVPAGGVVAKDVVLPVKRLGALRVDVADGASPPTPLPPGEGRTTTATAKAGGGEVLASMVFSVIPKPVNVPPERSVVGGHFATTSDWQMQIARRLGYKWTRIHDCSTITHWATVEAKQGEWKFVDDEVARVRKAGLAILGEFLRVPMWATTAKPDSEAYQLGVGPYRDVTEFDEYVQKTVNHYKGEIHCWEIWNEPYGSGFYGGTAEEYAGLARAAAKAAKAADPTCTLLAPCTTPYAPEWTEKVLAAGGTRAADYFSYHGYGCLSSLNYDRVNTWATRDGKRMTIWNTETGVTAKTFYRHTCDRLDDSYTRWIAGIAMPEAVSQSLKLFVLAIASGAQRYFYYWTNVETGMCPRMTSMSIYEYDRTIRPHGVVYAIAASLLDPCQGAGVSDYPSGITACFLEREQESVAVVWAKSKLASREMALRGLPAGTKALDAMGNSMAAAAGGQLRVKVTKEPVYLVAPGAQIGALREALGR